MENVIESNIIQIDTIQLDENNRCVSANCIYKDDDKTIEYEFDNEEERMSFFDNLQDYIYQDGKFILNKLPKPQPQATFEELQNDMNIDFDFRISELEQLKKRQEITEQALQDLILMTLGGE